MSGERQGIGSKMFYKTFHSESQKDNPAYILCLCFVFVYVLIKFSCHAHFAKLLFATNMDVVLYGEFIVMIKF